MTNSFLANSLDLSQNKSLRALGVSMNCAWGLICYPSATPATAFKHLLSTITSPVFSQITIFFQNLDFPGPLCDRASSRPHEVTSYFVSSGERKERALKLSRLSEMVRMMREVRDFKLVLCAHVWGAIAEHVMGELEIAVRAGWVERESDNISSRPSLTCSPRALLPAPGEVMRCTIGGTWRLNYPWAPL